MDPLLQKLIESDILDEKTKKAISEAWEKKLTEARKAAKEEARRELAEQYKADHDRLVSALDMMVREGLQKELAEFNEERQLFRATTAKRAKAISEARRVERARMNKAIKAMQIVMTEGLERELAEFKDDQKLQRRQVINAITESRARAKKAEEKFVQNGAKVLENIVEKQLTGVLGKLKSDIREARKNEVGRRMFEAAMMELRSTWFSTDKEAAKLQSELAATRKKLKESEAKSAAQLTGMRKKLDESTRAAAALRESAERKKKIDSLLARVKSASSRKEMRGLLESVPTDRLESAFRKYFVVVNERANSTVGGRKTRLSESNANTTLRTGSRAPAMDDTDREIADLARRIGVTRAAG